MILVTGGTGFVGRHLVTALLQRGEPTRVFTRTPAAPSPADGLDVFVGTLTDDAALARAMHGVTSVVHLAGRLPKAGGDDARLLEINVQAAERVALAARGAGVARFVHVSSGGVYGDGRTADPHHETDAPCPGNAYERSKLAGEVAVRQALDGSRVEWLILRPAGVFGPDRAATIAFLDEVRRRRLWLHSSPNVIVHPTHVSDVVQACVKALALEVWTERLINVAGERPVRFQEFVRLTAQALGVPVRQLVVPAWMGRPIAGAVSRTLSAMRVRVPSSVERAGRAYCNRSLDTTVAKRALGFEPIQLERALRETIDGRGM